MSQPHGCLLFIGWKLNATIQYSPYIFWWTKLKISYKTIILDQIYLTPRPLFPFLPFFSRSEKLYTTNTFHFKPF